MCVQVDRPRPCPTPGHVAFAADITQNAKAACTTGLVAALCVRRTRQLCPCTRLPCVGSAAARPSAPGSVGRPGKAGLSVGRTGTWRAPGARGDVAPPPTPRPSAKDGHSRPPRPGPPIRPAPPPTVPRPSLPPTARGTPGPSCGPRLPTLTSVRPGGADRGGRPGGLPAAQHGAEGAGDGDAVTRAAAGPPGVRLPQIPHPLQPR